MKGLIANPPARGYPFPADCAILIKLMKNMQRQLYADSLLFQKGELAVRQYIIRRLLISIIVLIGVSFLLYCLVRSMPADYVTLSTSTHAKITPEQKEHLRAIYGLDKSIPVGYVNWLFSALKGDLGVSLVYNRPVTDVMKDALPITFSILFIALIIQLLLGIPLGILAAKKRNTRTDYIITAFVFIGISLPSFFFASILKRALGYYGLDLFPVTGLLNARIIYDGFTLAKLKDYAEHLFMPMLVFVITHCGMWLRFTRANMIEALGSDYVRTARAKGVPERKVYGSHAYRNTLIPIVTLLGAQLPSLFSGAIIMEELFGIPGAGTAAFRAATMSDVPYLMGFNMLLAVCTVVGYLLSDIIYAVVDPRIRLS